MRVLITSHGHSVTDRERRGVNRVLSEFGAPYLANPIINVEVDIPQSSLEAFRQSFIEVCEKCTGHNLERD